MPASIHSLATPGAAPYANGGGREAPDCAAQPGQAVTSHSWSLSTGGFSLDFTWRRVENLAGEKAGSSQTTPAAMPVPSQAANAIAPAKPRQSFQEILRRRQLSQLLLASDHPPQGRQPLLMASQPSPPQPGPVCRAYAQTMGPLGGPGCNFSA